MTPPRGKNGQEIVGGDDGGGVTAVESHVKDLHHKDNKQRQD